MAALAPILTACGSGAPQEASVVMETLRIRYPQGLSFAAPFLLMKQDGPLQDHVGVEVGEASDPGMLGSMLINDETDVIAVPTHTAAHLAGQGHEVSLAAVIAWGNLSLIGPQSAAAGWAGLRGQTVSIPHPNDVPDLVFQLLANARGLERYDYQVQHATDPAEVVTRLANGDARWAVLPEPMATLALSEAEQQGRRLKRILNLQDEWAAVTGGQPRFPEAGIVVPTALADQAPQLVGALLEELAQAVQTIEAAEPSTVAAIATATAIPEPVVAEAIPRLHLEVLPAAQARSELEAFYNELAKLSPDITGGQLPIDSFYLNDPR